MAIPFYSAGDLAHYVTTILELAGTNVITGKPYPTAFGYVPSFYAGDIYLIDSDRNLITPESAAYSPVNGAVYVPDIARLFFFQDDGVTDGVFSYSDDGLNYSNGTYTHNGAAGNQFFEYAGNLYAIDGDGVLLETASDITGNTLEFTATATTIPGGIDPGDTITCGSDSFAGAHFFAGRFDGSDIVYDHFVFDGEFSVPVQTDLPVITPALGAFAGYSFWNFNDTFYVTLVDPELVDPAPSGMPLYSSLDGETWTLENSDMFSGDDNPTRLYTSVFYVGDILYAGCGTDASETGFYTSIYSSTQIVVPTSPTSGNQGITGGGINGQGGAVGFSGVSASNSSGISLASLAYPAGIVPRGVNDFGIDLGL